jgi:hypothetical protein
MRGNDQDSSLFSLTGLLVVALFLIGFAALVLAFERSLSRSIVGPERATARDVAR